MRRATAGKDEEGVANEMIPPHVDQLPIFGLENVNEVILPSEPQEPQGPQFPPMPKTPQAPFLMGI